MFPLVSIIIPCYNNQAFIESAIASAVHQTYANLEIIVIDDGSTDSSIEIIKTFGDKIYWETGKNQGAPLARNRGIALANGEYIKFLDADDVLLPDCIEKQVSQAIQLPSDRKAIVYGDAIWIDQHSQPIPSRLHCPRQPKEDAIAHILANSPLTSCPLHKRVYLNEIGGFDPSLPRGQEYDLHLRLVLSEVEFIHYANSVYKYREYIDNGRISQGKYSKKGAMFHFEALQKHRQLIEAKTGVPMQIEVRRILAKRFWSFGRGILREGYVMQSKEYFATAQQLHPDDYINGNMPYPILVRLLNPYWAEIVMNKLQSIAKLFSSKN